MLNVLAGCPSIEKVANREASTDAPAEKMGATDSLAAETNLLTRPPEIWQFTGGADNQSTAR